ncbi:MAG: hypothetical protein IKT12_05455, partial [Thermoguttaceae bacterium]|nr:hypothetical protein [Thermoguttaceae bacterium]
LLLLYTQNSTQFNIPGACISNVKPPSKTESFIIYSYKDDFEKLSNSDPAESVDTFAVLSRRGLNKGDLRLKRDCGENVETMQKVWRDSVDELSVTGETGGFINTKSSYRKK